MYLKINVSIVEICIINCEIQFLIFIQSFKIICVWQLLNTDFSKRIKTQSVNEIYELMPNSLFLLIITPNT